MDLLEKMRQIHSVDLSLERASITYKIGALLCKERPDMTAAELIADMDDDELGWAIAQEDKRIGCVPGLAMNPKLFRDLQQNRPNALAIADELIRKTRWR